MLYYLLIVWFGCQAEHCGPFRSQMELEQQAKRVLNTSDGAATVHCVKLQAPSPKILRELVQAGVKLEALDFNQLGELQPNE